MNRLTDCLYIFVFETSQEAACRLHSGVHMVQGVPGNTRLFDTNMVSRQGDDRRTGGSGGH